MKRLSDSAQDTRAYGRSLARRLKAGAILALRGPLGSGKTTFVKGLAQGLAIRHTIKSPTFVIFCSYRIPGGRRLLYHFDLYRLKNPGELSSLGFQEIVRQKHNIIAIEWPEKAEKFLPAKTLNINFSHDPGNVSRRLIKIS